MNTIYQMLSKDQVRSGLRSAALVSIAVGGTLVMTAPAPIGLETGAAINTELPEAEIPTVAHAPATTPSRALPEPAGASPTEAVSDSAVLSSPSPSSDSEGMPLPTPHRPVAVRSADGEEILHHYDESFAIVVGSTGSKAEIERVTSLLESRKFNVQPLDTPSRADFTSRLNRLGELPPPSEKGSRRLLIYLTGETYSHGGSVFFKAAPDSEPQSPGHTGNDLDLGELRHLSDDFTDWTTLVIINSGLREPFLAEVGDRPTFLTEANLTNPSTYFVISSSEGGQARGDFVDRFVNAFDGRGDLDGDRHVSAVELARSIGAPAYLATTSVGTTLGPGLVFDLPADAKISEAALTSARSLQKPESGDTQIPPPTMPTTALEAIPGGKPQESLQSGPSPLPQLADGKLPEEGHSFSNGPGISMIWLPPGQFHLNRQGETSNPSTAVAIDIKGFWMAREEVSHRQLTLSDATGVGNSTGNTAAGGVSWEEAVQYCERLTELERAKGRLPDGFVYRLPHEVEWEFASGSGPQRFRRANLLTVAAWGERLASGSTSTPTSPEGVTSVENRPLALTTDLKEWCADAFVPDSADLRSPPPPPNAKVVRGGLLDGEMVGISTRFGIYSATDKLPFLGFRVVLAPATIESQAPASSPAPLIAATPEKTFSRDELFEGTKYDDWDNYNKSSILKKAQSAFKELNLYDSSVDGAAGPSTQKAIIAYQNSRQLAMTGRLDTATLTALDLMAEAKKQAPPQGPWWVTRPNAPRNGDPEPPGSAYHGPIGRLKLIKDKEKGTIDQKEYRKFQTYARWENVQQ